MSRLVQLRELTRVRVLLFLREPEAVFWVFVFPMVLAAVLGFAFRSGKAQPSAIGVVPGASIESVEAALGASDEIEVERIEDEADARNQLRKGAIDGLVLATEPPALLFDPVRAEAATARLRVQRALSLAMPGAVDAPLALEPVEEKGSRYIDFLYPGLLGMNLMGTGIWGIGFALADIRKRKLLRRLIVTPMNRGFFFSSFMLSRLVFLVMEIGVLATFGAWVLGVPFRGDALSFAVLCLMGALTFAGLGILIAARVRTMEGASGLMNLVMMPMWLASGVFFSYERFPDALHPVIKLLPLTALNDALRAVMIDGESILTRGPEMLVMVVWTVVTFILALRFFRWE